MTSGIPGIGKSTWCHAHTDLTISGDAIRAEWGAEQAQSASYAVWQEVYRRLEGAITQNDVSLVAVDGLFTHAKERKQAVTFAKTHGVLAVLVIFPIDVPTAITQNALRERHVPDEVIRQKATSLQQSLRSPEDVWSEGWDLIWDATANRPWGRNWTTHTSGIATLVGWADGVTALWSPNHHYAITNARKDLVYTGFTEPSIWCKGTVWDRTGGLRTWRLPKFYNWDESAVDHAQWTRWIQDASVNIHALTKEDGTQIAPWIDDEGHIHWATRGRLDGEGVTEYLGWTHGQIAEAVATAQSPQWVAGLPEWLPRYSFVLELIHPATRVITNYGTRQALVLLAMYDKILGRELVRDEIHQWLAEQGLDGHLPLTDAITVPRSQFEDLHASLVAWWGGGDAEGVVILAEQGNQVLGRVKMKNPVYLALHRAVVSWNWAHFIEVVHGMQVLPTTWDECRATIQQHLPIISEELLVTSEQWFAVWQSLRADFSLRWERLVQIWESHQSIPDQKTFALTLIAEVPNPRDRAVIFNLRKGMAPADIHTEWLERQWKDAPNPDMPLSTTEVPEV